LETGEGATLLLYLSALVVASQILPILLALPLYPLGARAGRTPLRPAPAPGSLEIVVVSKASYGVIPSLLEVIARTRSLLPEYTLWVVVDEGSIGIPVLEEQARRLGFRLLIVPREYDKGKYKSRAIQYFIDTVVDPGKWYVFLDDDSYPLDRSFLHQLDPSIPVYNGLVYPRRGRSLVSWIADSGRYFHAITRARAALRGLNKPLYGLNGELLIVRGWVLRELGFATDSIVEDSMFAARLIRAGIRVGQVSTRVSILSPNTVVDLWRQRARWNLGVLRDIVLGRYPPLLALYRGADALAWLLAPAAPASWVMVASWALSLGGAAPVLVLAAGMTNLLAALAANTVVPAREYGLQGFLLALAMAPAVIASYILGTVYALLKADEILAGFVIIDKGGGSVRDKPRRQMPSTDPRLNPPSPGPSGSGVPAARAYIN